MPQYKNSNNVVITIGSLRIEPGETVSTNTFITNLPAGITQVTVTPVFDPVIYSEKITTSKTVSVPLTLDGNYLIRIQVTAGEVVVKYNDSSSIALYLGAGMKEERRCIGRVVDNIIFTITSGTVYLTIEKS